MIGSRDLPVDAVDHARGDSTGVLMPAHEAAFRASGEAFLTQAFRCFGAISAANSVARITRIDPCPGGSTGKKLFLTVEYAIDEPGLCRDLFVKFSRDFTDSRRDHARYEMESEARFGPVSRAPGFPIRVPTVYFADFEHETGTGLLVTERVAFAEGTIEPQHQKCCDHEIADPLSYYRSLVTALARLAAAHKAGELSGDVDRYFPFDPERAGLDPIACDEAALHRTMASARQFALDMPQLLPATLRSPDLYDRLLAEALRVFENQDGLSAYLLGDRDLIALCHWNAHIDNAWFWREEGALRCGLMDWGRVSQITFGAALWGCLSAAHQSIAEDHLDALLDLFADEYRSHGGPAIDTAELKQHFYIHVAMMGVARVFSLHKVVQRRLPEAARARGPLDPIILADEATRTVLHIYTMLLTLWAKPDFSAALDRLIAS